MGHLHLKINDMLTDRKISKNAICRELDIPRANFNRYCRDEFQRIDANLIIKLCEYLECGIADLLEIREKDDMDEK